ncbi:TPA: restriction endonuclease subunit S [Haemophilus influenzae]|uniref:restriction endonuclease subunit S n=1 Tax=Haemophilus influenzae TaxID=727 RepID=UPI000D42B085|nr:restriction endonuclease subunit S [Haemophilus influenzae]MCK8803774.1 restriction endonuclease subunit S [Haemophilus influenzae]MCK8896369.1 restriction endonuclease subunit S [Haemophilus influenzae]MCK8971197.1 restriction endonuclease subunit S [Haemophilus influenzae]MCK8985175.1 restriction endonuclease subunit S [Haemophilus influenzae]MCK9073947.1 restriction endonuclease subunit S [Haemophilus influenzae]
MNKVEFGALFLEPLRNGVTKPKRVRGSGYKMVNMGEIFSLSFIQNQTMDRVPLTDKEKATTLLQNNDLLFARQSLVRDGAGKCSIFLNDNEPVCFESHIIRVRLNQELCYPMFYYYFFSSRLGKNTMDKIIEQGAGAAGIRGSDLAKLEVPYIGYSKQKEIADSLYSFDQKIQLNTQINQTLEQIAQALFKSWFVDFDPVRAKAQALSDGMSLEQAELAAMQAISGKTAEELTALSQTQSDRYTELAETAKAFPCEMVEVDGVEVPRGWEMKALSDLGQIICGKTPSKSNKEFYGDDVPFIKIPDMHNQVFITQTTDNLSVVGANYQSKKYIPAKSICVSCIATVGLVSMTSKPSHTNQQINSIIPDDEQSCEFLYLSLKQPSMTKYLKDLASGGTATFNLNTSTFSKIEIITPSKEIIYIFQKKVVSIFEKTLSNSIENKRLTEIRDLLLPRLLNGEI